VIGRVDWQTRPVREPVVITDPADTRVDAYRTLRARESSEGMWAEGPTVVERLLATPLPVRSLLLTPAAHARLVERCGSLLAAKGADIWVAEQAAVNAIVGFDLHRGAIAVAERPSFGTLDTVIDGARRLVVLEGVNDHENLGAIARTARARVLRRKQPIYDGGLATLRRFTDDVKEVRSGLECGIKLGDFSEYLPEDIIECYTLEKVPQQL